jgi:hypothetical protein
VASQRHFFSKESKLAKLDFSLDLHVANGLLLSSTQLPTLLF